MITKIIGSPGAGKTERMLQLFEKEIQHGVRPDRIAFLTFTRAARAEAATRSGRVEKELPFVRTIHSICYRQLGVNRGQMIKARDLKRFGEQVGVNLSGYVPDPWSDMDEYRPPTKEDVLIRLNHLGRHRQQTVAEALNEPAHEYDLDFKYAKWFTLAYKAWKEREGFYDYTDLLTEYNRRGDALDIDVMFVDEAQDLSRLQWLVVHQLAKKASRVYLCGDPDQAIFTWAGASAEAFLDQPCDHEYALEKSYRLPRRVLDYSQRIIEQVGRRPQRAKPVEPRGEGGEIFNIPDVTSAPLDDDTLILFRVHLEGNKLQRQLLDAGVPFQGSMSPTSNPEVHAALTAWLAFARGERVKPRDAWAVVQYARVSWLADHAAQESYRGKDPISWDHVLRQRPTADNWIDGLSKLEDLAWWVREAVARNGWERTLAPRIRVMSIHQAKGRQAHTVVVDPALTARVLDSLERSPDDEHRVFYVAATRAKERLALLPPLEQRFYPLPVL